MWGGLRNEVGGRPGLGLLWGVARQMKLAHTHTTRCIQRNTCIAILCCCAKYDCSFGDGDYENTIIATYKSSYCTTHFPHSDNVSISYPSPPSLLCSLVPRPAPHSDGHETRCLLNGGLLGWQGAAGENWTEVL